MHRALLADTVIAPARTASATANATEDANVRAGSGRSGTGARAGAGTEAADAEQRYWRAARQTTLSAKNAWRRLTISDAPPSISATANMGRSAAREATARRTV